MNTDDIRWLNDIDEIKKLTLKSGDCLVATSKVRLRQSEYEGLKSSFEYLVKALGFKENEIKLVVLENDMRLGILSKEDQ